MTILVQDRPRAAELEYGEVNRLATEMEVKIPWNESGELVIQGMSSSLDSGLSVDDARERLAVYGANRLETRYGRKWYWVLLAQFKSLLVLLLVIAALLAFVFRDWIEGFAICAVLVINAMIGFFTELSALRTMESLRKFNQSFARVKRGGEVEEISVEMLVPGDIVLVEAGDLVAADMRILSCSRLQVNESSLTGESFPVDKHIDVLDKDTILAERSNMLYKGTSVTRGACEAVVIATGEVTELGKISSLVMVTEDEQTPLERRLARLSRKLIVVTLFVTLFTLVVGLLRGKELYLMIETSIALAVAAIPEGLPIIATLALARGMWRMARSNALINRLSAVETLGATNVICTDKTGTLTENRMVLVSMVTSEGVDDLEGVSPCQLSEEILNIGVLCNDAHLGKTTGAHRQGDAAGGVGDPMELALLVAAKKRGMSIGGILGKFPRIREEAFDSDLKMMASLHRDGDQVLFAVKGAAESVLTVCDQVMKRGSCQTITDEERQEWLNQNDRLARNGLRVLAFAKKQRSDAGEYPYEGLVFVGLACVVDPARKDIRAVIRSCRDAGIRVVMITGDQAGTALHVAREVGIYEGADPRVVTGKEIEEVQQKGEMDELLDVVVFSRVTPKNKLDIIQLHQNQGLIVAMTGDGVNDAPALKKADIGVAMGIRGTEVAREASDMVLRDDAFTSIVAAVSQGRVIFNNIRKFVVYLLSCNLSEILVVGLASGMGAPLPLLPLQILFLNMVTDVFPALALGACQGHEDVMSKPPRPMGDPIIGKRQWREVMLYSGLITLVVLVSFAIARVVFDMSAVESVTISFLVIALAQLFHVFNMAEPESGVVKNEVTRNPYTWGAVVLCIIILYGAVSIPPLSHVLSLQMPDGRGLLLVVVASVIPLFAGRCVAFFKRS